MTRIASPSLLIATALLSAFSAAAQIPANIPPNSGLAGHDFFYAGEQKQHWMFIVRGGQVVWSYINAASKGEIRDATLLPRAVSVII